MPRASRSNKAPFPLSIGLDIVEVGRVERLARRNARFIGRVFTSEEIRYCEARSRKWQHYAVRFAAKEAVWKALGRESFPLKAISIRRGPSGKPEVWLKSRRAPEVQVSLSHSERHALAVAVCWPPHEARS